MDLEAKRLEIVGQIARLEAKLEVVCELIEEEGGTRPPVRVSGKSKEKATPAPVQVTKIINRSEGDDPWKEGTQSSQVDQSGKLVKTVEMIL